MKFEMELRESPHWPTEPRAYVEVNLINGTTATQSFDYLTMDMLEDLELELTNMIQKLYDYRQKQGSKE